MFRWIGRLAFPIFCYCLTVGLLYTHDVRKYLTRLGIFALISQPFYIPVSYTHLDVYKRQALSRNVFPMDTAAEAEPEPAAICTYSPEIERYIDHCMNAIRADTAEMLKSLAAAHFEGADGREGDGCVVIRRSATPEP